MTLAIWWTTNEEAHRLGGEDEHLSDARIPAYIHSEFRSRIGRNGRGRLWVAPEMEQLAKGQKIEVEPWPTGKDETPLVRYCAKAAGIVLDADDVPSLQGLPGVVTDFRLQRLPSCPCRAPDLREPEERNIVADNTVRVSFHCTAAQLRAVKRAAALAGIPYQSWIKIAAWNQAVADLNAASEIEPSPNECFPPVGPIPSEEKGPSEGDEEP